MEEIIMSALGIGDRFIHPDHPNTILTVYDVESGRVVCSHLDLLGRHIEFNGEQMNQFVSLEYKNQ